MKILKPKQQKQESYMDSLIQMGWEEINRYGINQERKNRKIKSYPTFKTYHTLS